MAEEKRTPRILVADDEPEILNLVRMTLELDGHAVIEAGDGRSALALASRELPDLILLDVRMPSMSGLHVLERLRADPATATIPIIMLSVVTTYPEVRQALQKGAVAYVSKPFELREMTRLVSRVLGMDDDTRDKMRLKALEMIGKER